MKYLLTIIFSSCLLNFSIGQKQTILNNDTLAIKNLQQENETRKMQVQQLSKEVTDLKATLQRQQKIGYDKFSSSSAFIDAAISSTNNLQSLVLKESYRNKIVSLNNPTSNELGFNLELEIQNSLKPLMAKTNKTNNNKLGQVVGTVMQAGKASVGLFPAANVFTSLVSMVGSVTVQEKKIEKEDLDGFIKNIEKYFNQYERLHIANKQFNADMEKIKGKLKLLQEDIQLQLIDLVLVLDKTLKRKQLKNIATEDLMLQYFDSRRIQEQLTKQAAGSQIQFPQDAVKGCKEIANNIQRIYDEYASVYNSNYKEIKTVISDTKTVGTGVDGIKLNNTLKELEALYAESKSSDVTNLRLKTLFERLEAFIQ